MSRNEMRAWVTALAIAGILVFLTVRMVDGGSIFQAPARQMALTATLCYLFFAASEIGTTRLFLHNRTGENITDERDAAIMRRSHMFGMFFLGLAVVFMAHQTTAGAEPERDALFVLDLDNPATRFYALLASFFGMFLTERIACILMYRGQSIRA